ncbi:MAG: HAD hydrolase family protein, partial [Chloroflexota bacterium]
MANIRLVALDIDGCLTAGEAKPFDFEALAFIAALNRRARVDAAQFAVTLCTGRPEPYVEALTQAIDGFMPAIFENGGGLYFPSPYRFAFNPAITPPMRATLADIRSVLQRELVATGIAQFQPGKEVTATLYPSRADVSLAQLATMARAAVGDRLDGYAIFASVSCVEIMPKGIDKGAALEWLSQETGIALSEMAGIGDAPA